MNSGQRALKIVEQLQERVRTATEWDDELEGISMTLEQHGFVNPYGDIQLGNLEASLKKLGFKVDADIVLRLIAEIKERRAKDGPR